MIKNILLVSVSLLFSLLLVEIILKINNFNSLSDFYPRYETLNYTSHEESQYTFSDNLPMVMKKNYSFFQCDMANRPVLVKIDLDKNGFRNNAKFEKIENFDVLFVGDSVSFGYGVDNNETFVSKYIKSTNKNVYNLSVPNVGPATYMYLIDKFLVDKSTKVINIMWYSANDFMNFSNSYWEGMHENRIPKNEKITRSDIINKTTVYPEYMFYPIIKKSSLILLLHNLLVKKVNKEISAHEYNMMKNMLINYLKKGIDYNLHNKKIDIYINELKNIKEIQVNEKLRKLLSKIELQYKANNRKDLFKLTKEFQILLEKNKIQPISNKYKCNLGVYLNSSLGFNSDNKLEDNFDGIVKSIFILMKSIKDIKFQKDIAKVKNILNNYKTISFKSIEKLDILLSKLSSNFKNKKYKQISLDSKLNIFFNYLSVLKNNGIQINIFNYTGEYRLQSKYNNVICNRAVNYDLKCVNVTPLIQKYYMDKSNFLHALYLDGSHFNNKGNTFINEILLDTLE